MANYNVDLLVRASTDAALRGLDKVAQTVDQVIARAKGGIDFGEIRGFNQAQSKLKSFGQSVKQVGETFSAAIGVGLWGNLSSGINGLNAPIRALQGPLTAAKGLMGSFIEEAIRGVPVMGDAIYAAGSNFDKFAQWFSALDPATQVAAAGIAALTPQVFKLTRAFTKKKQSLIGVSKGFSLINEAGQKANGSLINGMTSVQLAIEKAAAAQQKFDQSLRGASLTQLNQVTRQAKNELEGYWSMTGKAEKAAKNYAKALKAQKLEQEAINRLVKEAKEGLPLTKSEQQEAAVELAAQKELALKEKAQQKRKEDHERRMRKFDRDRIKAAKARTKIEQEAQRAQRLREGLMLGVGFPLLFGGGPGAIIGGGAGALVQSQLGKGENKGKGFGAQIALSAVGGQIDRLVAQIVGGLVAVGKAVTTTANAYEYLEEKSLFSTKQIQERAKALKEQGEVEKLNTLLTKEYARLVGREGFNDLQRAGNKAKELGEAWDELSLAMSALASGPLADTLEAITKILDYHAGKARLKLLEKDLIAQGDSAKATEMRKEMLNLGQEGLRLKGGFFPVNPLTSTQQADIYKKYSAFRKTDGMGFGESGDLGKRAKLTDSQKIAAERERLELVFKYGEREAAILTKTNKLLDAKDGKKAASLRKDMEAINQLKDMNEIYKGIGQTIKDGLVEGINAAIDGTKTLGEIASNVFRQISNQLISYGINASLGSIPGLEKIFGRASGGPVKGGSPYIVGEKGPELFVPGSSGNIVPNHAMGGTNVVVNVDASGSSVEGDGGQAEELGGMLAAAVQAEIANQQRPGGLLAGTR